MDRRLIIKILKLLEEAYTNSITAETLMKKTRLRDIDGQFSQIIKYLKDTNKIIVVLVPENRMGLPTGRDKLHRWLQRVDEITITPAGIDFLTELKRLETDKTRNELLADTTIVLTQVAIIGIVLALYEKLKLPTSSIEIPWLLSAIGWAILISFVLLLFYKIINIIFSKESWKGILFDRD
jgi:hypothetical protein